MAANQDELAIETENNNLMNLKSNFDFAIMDAELEGETETGLSIYESSVSAFDEFIFNYESDLKEDERFKDFIRSYNSKVLVKDEEENEDGEGSYYTDPIPVETHQFLSDFIQGIIEKNERLLNKR